MIYTNYGTLSNSGAVVTQGTSSGAKSVQAEDVLVSAATNYSGDGVILTLSGQTDFVTVKSVGTTSKSLTGSTPPLRMGSRGEAVVQLQTNLTQLGYDTNGTDGIFGEDTKAAVMAFQRAYGLSADGVVGSATQEAIKKALDY